jgi:maleylacetoacetate isomerase
MVLNVDEALEKMLAKTAGKYCFGDSITLADCVLVPQVFNAKRWEVDMSKFPIISRIDAELATHPAFKAAHPDVQPDAPKSP